MQKIAITGGIASGKSFLLKALSQNGFKVESADDMVAKYYLNSAFLKKISTALGEEVFCKEDVKKILLKSPYKIKILEKVIYKQLFIDLQNAKGKIVEIPLLFEKNLQKNYNFIINIETPVFIQKRNFVKRTGSEKNFYFFKKLQLHQVKKQHKMKFAKGITVCNYNSPQLLKLNIQIIKQRLLGFGV